MNSGKGPRNMGQRARKKKERNKDRITPQSGAGVLGCDRGVVPRMAQWRRHNRDIQEKICMLDSTCSLRNGRATPLECRPRGAESRLQEADEELYFYTPLSRNVA